MEILENTDVRVILKPERSKSVENRHLWVFSGGIDQITGSPESGDIVSVYTSDNQFLGKGFINFHSQIRIRFLTFENEEINEKFLLKRFEQAAKLRHTSIPSDTSAYRLIHAEGDLLSGLIVDRYQDVLVMQIYSLGFAKIKAILVKVLLDMFKPEAIYESSNSSVLKQEGMSPVNEVLSGSLSEEVQITENGVKFYVDILRGQKTGFFLDQRENRRLIGGIATGKQVLNCFSYTGGFSVYAALNKAITTSIDIDDRAIELARRNFQLNGLDTSDHQFVVANVFEELRSLETNYEIIILDPPAFVKKRNKINQGAQAYKDINRLAIKNVVDGGLLLTCSCSAYVNWDLFQKIIFSAAQEAGRHVQIISKRSQPLDHPINIFHPSAEYLKSFLLRVYD